MSRVIAAIEEQLKTVTDPFRKIDLMNQLIIESRDNAPEVSIQWSEQTLASARALNYTRGIAYGLLNMGYLQDFQGEKEAGLVHLNQALQLFEALEDREGLGYSYKYLCWYYWGLGEMNKALQLMLKGLKLNEGTQSIIEGWALFVIGVFYGDMKDDALAEDYLEQAREVFAFLDYEHGLGRTHNALSSIHMQRGQNDLAQEHSEKALLIHQASGYLMGLARTYNDLGTIFTRTGRPQEAIEQLNRSLALRRGAKNRQAVISTLTALADAHRMTGHYEQALTSLDEAEALASTIGAQRKRIHIRELMIKIHEARQQPWEALKHAHIRNELNARYLQQDADSRIKSMEALLHEEQKERQVEQGRLRNAELELQKQRIEMLFGQQVSAKVVRALLDKEGKYDVQETEASIMFLDIRDFTVFARGKDPREVIEFQNNVFSPLIEIISQHDGIINQILGDGFMASFGIPLYFENHCQRAFDAGLRIIERMQALSADGLIPQIKVGIGLHTGNVISGNIGNEIRKQFSIAGENVIVAARLEQLNKAHQSQFLISQEVYKRMSTERHLHSLGPTALKGFEQPMVIYRVI